MQKLHGHLDVNFINETFFLEIPPEDINTGRCFLWGYIAYRLYKNLELWDTGSHVFVRSKVTGKFYDSESPEGTESWQDLPATNGGYGCGCFVCKQPARKFTTAGLFRKTWYGMRKRYKVDYNQVHQQILQIIKAQSIP